MQSPKHLLNWKGRPLGLFLCDLLQETLGQAPVLVGDGPPFHDSVPYGRISDAIPCGGPAGGILAALRFASGDDVLVMASDLPLMTGTALKWIIEQADRTTKPAIWPRHPDRRYGEPLAAVYRSGVQAQLGRALDAGLRRMTELIVREERFEPIIPTELRSAFTNVNTPQEWAAIHS